MWSNHEFETRAVAEWGNWHNGDVVSPIHLSSTYELPGIDPEMSLEDIDPADGEFIYQRLSNPTRFAAEQQIASLEGGEFGFTFSSGTAAISTALLSIVQPGDHVVAFDDLYAGTRRMFEGLFDDHLNIDVEFVDARETETVKSAISPETALVWMETPTNPLIQLCDIEAIAALADEHDALFGVDNTFASPYYQRPLELGADLVAHSTTKYLNGHSDGVGGALVTDAPAIADSVQFLQQVALGNQLSPFDSYLLSRGIKTLPTRMRQHEANATVLAEFLAGHDLVEQVRYPGLESHPQYDIARKQMNGYGGVLSFDLVGGIPEAKAFCEALQVATLAVSLGGVETLVNHAATMTHEPLGPERRAEVGIGDGLIRVSVGLEAIEDLIADFERGFEAVRSTRKQGLKQ